jgi:hypothetical protein
LLLVCIAAGLASWNNATCSCFGGLMLLYTARFDEEEFTPQLACKCGKGKAWRVVVELAV